MKVDPEGQTAITHYKVSGSLPKKCSAQGKTYLQYDYSKPMNADSIILTNLPAAPVLSTSPVEVEGAATREWFTNNTLTVELYVGNGKLIAHGDAAQKLPPGIILTPADKIPFSISLSFGAQERGQMGALIIKNPASSTLTFVVPVTF